MKVTIFLLAVTIGCCVSFPFRSDTEPAVNKKNTEDAPVPTAAIDLSDKDESSTEDDISSESTEDEIDSEEESSSEVQTYSTKAFVPNFNTGYQQQYTSNNNIREYVNADGTLYNPYSTATGYTNGYNAFPATTGYNGYTGGSYWDTYTNPYASAAYGTGYGGFGYGNPYGGSYGSPFGPYGPYGPYGYGSGSFGGFRGYGWGSGSK